MFYKDYMNEIDEKGYKLVNNIFVVKKSLPKKQPKCYNPVFQKLVERIQDNKIPLSEREYNLYGQMIMTLVQIVINNHHFKFQEPEIKEECKTAAYCCMLDAGPKNFDRNRGSSAYSYYFRLAYTSMIHVLEDKNQRTELENSLHEAYDEYMLEKTNGMKVCTKETEDI